MLFVVEIAKVCYNMVMITIAMLTKNNQRTIRKTLESIKNFEEIIIVDTGSSDDTLKILEQFSNVKIFHSEFVGFGKLRNIAAERAKNDWILSLDSDEMISDQLCKEIMDLKLNPQTVYSIPFKNFYNDKHIRWCGWYPEYHCRLYNKRVTQFEELQVHEKISIGTLYIKKLENCIHHHSIGSSEDFLSKIQTYSTLFAKENHLKKSSSFSKALFHGFFSFFKTYILKGGILDGKEGFIISIYNANTSFYKYLKLYEKNQKCS